MQESGSTALASSLQHVPNLQKLRLWGQKNMSAACEIMDGLRFVSSLMRLNIGNCSLEEEGSFMVAEGLHHVPGLVSLEIWYTYPAHTRRSRQRP
mmetsp:Transcript_42612/g.89098  ORF Transcript_42612/g.89098 Transcript_42612/m.89098 type:complete len:95 (-) Transcript_42612:1092-1376(-)